MWCWNSQFSQFVRVKRTCQIPCQPTKRGPCCHVIVSSGTCWRKIVCETHSLLKIMNFRLKSFHWTFFEEVSDCSLVQQHSVADTFLRFFFNLPFGCGLFICDIFFYHSLYIIHCHYDLHLYNLSLSHTHTHTHTHTHIYIYIYIYIYI